MEQQHSQFLQNPSDVNLFQKLEGHYMERQDFENLLEIYQTRQSSLEDKEAYALFTKGAHQAQHQGQNEAAFKFYQEALEIDQSREEDLKGARSLAISLGKWEKAIEYLNLESRNLKDPSEKAKKLYQAGRIHLEHLDDPKKAEVTFNKALLLDSENLPCIEALEKIYRQQESWEMLAGVLSSKESVLTDDEEKTRLAMEIAQLWEEKLDNFKQATSWYFKVVYRNPGSFEVMDRLDTLTFEKDWDQYLRIRLLRAGETKNGEEASEILKDLGQFWTEKLQRPSRGIACYQRALERHPQDREAIDTLVELYREYNSPYNLSRTLRKKADDFLSSPDEKLPLYREGAEIIEDKDPAQALSIYLKALAIAPQSRELLQKVKTLTSKMGLWQNYLEILEREIEFTEEEEKKCELWREHGSIQREKLEDLDEALSSYFRALEYRPSDREALKKVEEILKEQEKWAELTQHYERALENLTDPENRFQILFPFAQLKVSRLQDKEGALELLAEAWKIRPEDDELFTYYNSILEDQEDYETLYDLYSDKVNEEWASGNILEWVFKGSEVAREKLGDFEKARDLLEKGYDKHPVNLNLLKELSQCYLTLEEWKKAVDILQEQIQIIEDGNQKAELYLELGKIYRNYLEKIDEAISFYQHALSYEPENLEALNALKGIYREEKNYSELVKTLQREAQIATSPPTRKALLLEGADLISEHIDPGSLAEDAYSMVLQEFPRSKKGFEGLTSSLEHQEKHLELAKLYKKWAKFQDTLKERFEYLVRSGDLYFETLNKPDKAIKIYDRALVAYPRDKRILKRLSQIYKERENYSRQLEILEKYVHLVEEDEEEKVRLEMGRLLQNEFEVLDKAAIHYDRALEINGQNEEAREALLAIYRQEENWKNLLPLLREKLEITEGDQEKIDLLTEAATVAEEHFSRRDLASEFYTSILEIDPTHQEALQALRKILSKQKDWISLAQTYEHELEYFSQDFEGVIQSNYALAEIYKNRLFKANKAAQCYQRILKTKSSEEDAIQELIQIYTQRQRWQDLIDLYEGLIQSSDNLKAAEYFIRLGEVYELFEKDFQKAQEHYRKALERNSAYRVAFQKLGSVLRHLEKYEELTQMYLDWLEVEEEILQARNICFELGNVYELYLENYEKAAEYYSRALEMDQDYLPAIAALNYLLTLSGNHEALIDFLDREASISEDPQRKAVVYFEMGRLAYEKLESSEEAIEHLLKSKEAQNEHLPTLHLLQEIYRKEEKWEELFQVLQEEEKLIESEGRKVWLLQQGGEVLKDHLQQYDRAEEILKEALELDDQNVKTHLLLAEIHREKLNAKDLFHSLARVADLHSDSNVKRNVLAEMARLALNDLKNMEAAKRCLNLALNLDEEDLILIEALRSVLKKEGIQEEYVKWCEREIKLRKNPTDAFPLRLELGEIFVEKEEFDRAIATLLPVVEKGNRKEKERSLSLMEKAYARQEDWEGLVEVLEEEVEFIEEEEKKKELLLRLGEVTAEKLSLSRVAKDYYQRVLEISPENEKAISALEELLTGLEEWADLAEFYQHRASNVTDIDKKVESYAKAGWIFFEHLDKPRQAFPYYQLTLKLDPDHSQALSDLIEICRKLENHSELVELLSLKAEKVREKSSHEYAPLLAEVGQTLERHLKDKQRAVEVWEEVLEFQPSHREAISALDRLYTALGRWKDLIEILEEKARLAREEQGKGKIYLRIGEIYHKNLADLVQAAHFYREGARLLDDKKEALEGLSEIYRANSNFSELAKNLEKRIDLAHGEEEKRPLRRELAEVHKTHLKNYLQAISLYEAVRSHASEDREVRDELKELYETCGFWEKLIRILEEELEETEEGERKLELFMEIGRLWHGELNRPTPALKAWEKAFEINSKNREVIDSLIALYRKLEKHKELVEIYQAELAVAKSEEEKIAIQHHLGETYRHGLQEDIQAINAFEEALRMDPEDWISIASLEELYPRAGRWMDLAGLCHRAADLAEKKEETLRYLINRAQILHDQCNDCEEAVETLREALSIDDHHQPALELMATYGRELELWEELLHINGRLAHHLEGKKLAHLYLEMGEIYYEHLEDEVRALEHLEKSLEVSQEIEEALVLARQLYLKQEKWPEAARTLDEQKKLLTDASRRADLEYERARIHLDHLGERERATELFEEVLRDAPQHRDTLAVLSDLFYEDEKWQKAQTHLSDLLDLLVEEDDRELRIKTHFRLGEIHRRDEKWSEAISHYQSSLQDDGEYLPSLKELSKIYYDQEDWENAFSTFEKINSIYSQDPSGIPLKERLHTWRRLGQAAFGLDKLEEGRQYYNQVLEKEARDLDSLFGLYEIACRQSQYDQATQHLSRYLKIRIDKGDQDRELASQFREMGEIFRRHLKNFSRAIQSYKKSIEIDDQYYSAYRDLVDCAETNSQWDTLIEYGQRALKLTSDEEEMIHLHLSLGKAYSRKNSFQEALGHLEEILKRQEFHGPALEEEARIYVKQNQWDKAAEVLEKYLNSFENLEEQVPFHLRLAQIYENKLGHPQQAINHLKWVLKADPDHQGAHSSLARIYSNDPKMIREAIEEHYYFIKAEPWKPDHYRNLLSLYQKTEQWDGWFCVAEVLHLLGDLAPSEKEAYDRGLRRLPFLNQSVSRSTMERHLTQPEERLNLPLLLEQTEGELQKVFPPTHFDRYSLRRRDALDPQSDHPLATLYQNFVQAFGEVEVDLFAVEDPNPGIFLENTSPPSLILTSSFLSLPERQARYMVGQKLALVLKKRTILDKISGEEFLLWLDGLEEFYDKSGGPEEVVTMSKKIKSSLSWRTRRSLDGALRKYQQAGEREKVMDFYSATLTSAQRFGLIFSNSLKSSLEALHRQSNHNSIPQMIRNSPYVQSLIFFGLTSEFLTFRKSHGLSLER